MAYRVVADHIRTLTIALSDKGKADKVGRGYVLRRILRRAIRYFRDKLEGKPGVLSSLVDVVVEILGDVFPELKVDPQVVKKAIDAEETQFLKTLVKGEKLFNKAIDLLPTDEKLFPGDVAWKLYDTFGFPVDLTQLMAEEKGLQVDFEKYETSKKEAIARSAAGSGKLIGTSS